MGRLRHNAIYLPDPLISSEESMTFLGNAWYAEEKLPVFLRVTPVQNIKSIPIRMNN
ncbi:MAG: hypothetical protein IIC39_02730 [Candidatus Marinimicrobia bacterium]|nr:hypothetical protein [Candidatus Neomarinimicrobiota bacterium]MCH8304798.1 hypothetical protein [Candidatus Neomarinimicrobiota bacterium]